MCVRQYYAFTIHEHRALLDIAAIPFAAYCKSNYYYYYLHFTTAFTFTPHTITIRGLVSNQKANAPLSIYTRTCTNDKIFLIDFLMLCCVFCHFQQHCCLYGGLLRAFACEPLSPHAWRATEIANKFQSRWHLVVVTASVVSILWDNRVVHEVHFFWISMSMQSKAGWCALCAMDISTEELKEIQLWFCHLTNLSNFYRRTQNESVDFRTQSPRTRRADTLRFIYYFVTKKINT